MLNAAQQLVRAVHRPGELVFWPAVANVDLDAEVCARVEEGQGFAVEGVACSKDAGARVVEPAVQRLGDVGVVAQDDEGFDAIRVDVGVDLLPDFEGEGEEDGCFAGGGHCL